MVMTLSDDEEREAFEYPDRSEAWFCRCGRRLYFHANIGASVLWCPEHGWLGTYRYVFDPDDEVVLNRRMSEDEYDRFVENRVFARDDE